MSLTILKRIRKDNKYTYHETIINDESDLLSWINKNIGVHKYVGINKKLSNFIKPLIINDIKISHKKFLRDVIKESGSVKTQSSIHFWTARGYSKDNANKKAKEFQSKSSKAFANKLKKDPDKYKGYNSTQIEYWINKGYSEIEAREKLRERQTTFSLEKCIKKYGKEKGTKIFNERQLKWSLSRQQSLNEGVWDWDSCGMSFTKWESKYGSSWVNVFVDSINNKSNIRNKDLYKTIKKHYKNIESYLLNLPLEEFKPLSNIGLVNYLTKKTPIQLKEFWCKENGVQFIKTKFGNISYDNENFYQSEGEFEIGKYLESIGVNFDIHKQYETTSYITDFYLPKFDMYIEYMGMNGKSYYEKQKALNKLGFKIIWSSDINFIKNKINEKIQGNK